MWIYSWNNVGRAREWVSEWVEVRQEMAELISVHDQIYAKRKVDWKSII